MTKADRDGSAFTGDCYHCGETGHRKFECPKADDGKPDKGSSKGKSGKGDKDKGKGGKSLDYAGVDAGTEQAAAAPAAEEEWWMGAQCSVVRELSGQPTTPPPPTPPRSWPARSARFFLADSSYPPAGRLPGSCDVATVRQLSRQWPGARRPVPTSNTFSALAELEDAAAWPLPAKCSAKCSTCCCETASTEKVARAPVDSCAAAEKDASAPAAARFRKQLRKYVALCTRDEVLLQAVAKEPTRPGYRLVEAVFDSGAEESVSPPRFFPGPVVPSTMSKAGGSYRVANGHRVPNIGQQAVHFETDEGQAAGMMFQTAEIERPLISASQLAASGNSVVFNQQGGTIVHEKSGRRTVLHKRGGIYVLRMWIPENLEQGFAGPGR